MAFLLGGWAGTTHLPAPKQSSWIFTENYCCRSAPLSGRHWRSLPEPAQSYHVPLRFFLVFTWHTQPVINCSWFDLSNAPLSLFSLSWPQTPKSKSPSCVTWITWTITDLPGQLSLLHPIATVFLLKPDLFTLCSKPTTDGGEKTLKPLPKASCLKFEFPNWHPKSLKSYTILSAPDSSHYSGPPSWFASLISVPACLECMSFPRKLLLQLSYSFTFSGVYSILIFADHPI